CAGRGDARRGLRACSSTAGCRRAPAVDPAPLVCGYRGSDHVDFAGAPPGWFEEPALTWVQDTAIRFGPGTVETTRQHFDADHVVIATGAVPKTLDLAKPVYTLRSLADAQALRAALQPGVRVAIAGGGLLAPELATSAKTLGAKV